MSATGGADHSQASSHQQQQQHHHQDDRLSRLWRTMVTSVLVATSKAEKAAKEANKATLKEVDEAVIAFLRNRVDWGRLISYLEAKLEGKAKEMEILQHYVRSQPSMGIRKRKRETDTVDENKMAKTSPVQPAQNTTDGDNLGSPAPLPVQPNPTSEGS